MPAFQDLTGRRFGKLTVLYRVADHVAPSGRRARMWHCKCDCGNECDARADSLTQRQGGKTHCGCSNGHKKTHDEFIKELSVINPNINVLGIYMGSLTPIQVSCNVCGHVWAPIPSALKQGEGCPICGHKSGGLKLRKSDSEFKAQMEEANPNIEILGTYTTATERVTCKCKVCSHEWKTHPSDLLRGSNCPKCARTGTSFVEQVILLTLKKLCPCEVIGRDRALIGMELDILIPAMHVAIEYGAWAWHKNKTDRDQEKARLCEDKGILLLQVFDGYTGTENDTDCVWYYRENIVKQKGLYMVKELVIRICERIGVHFTLNDDEFDEILCEAHRNSKKDTTESFNKMLEEIGSNVRLLGDYQGMHIHVLAECQACGYRWKSTPGNLKKGHGCRICAKAKTRHSRKVICVESGIIYDSIKKASEVTTISCGSIGMCCRGKYKTAGGYHWKYVDRMLIEGLLSYV